MFVPRPQTHHVSRHYSLQTTSKKNQDKENSNANTNALPSKTPSRAGVGKMLIPNTAAAPRHGLGGGKGGTVGQGQGQQDGGKGKGKEVDDIGPKRLFTTSTGTGTGMSSSKSFGSFHPTKSKTPARASKQQNGVGRTPGPANAKPIMGLPPLQTPLPSASKPRRSSRRSTSISISHTPAGPPILEDKPKELGFATPAPGPRNLGWDEGDSMGSISEGLNELALGPGVSGGLGEVVEEEEDGEPEYMPPRAIPLPWESIGAVACIEQDARIITQFPPLWSMIPVRGSVPELPELEPGIESYPEQQEDDELEEPFFRELKLAAVATAAAAKQAQVQAAPRRQPSHARFASTSTTSTSTATIRSKAPIPSRGVRTLPTSVKTTTTMPNLKSGTNVNINTSARVTKPPVPRLGSRTTTPALPTSTTTKPARPAGAVPMKAAPRAPTLRHKESVRDVGVNVESDLPLPMESEPILFEDDDFGFSDTDFDNLQTP